MLINCENLGHQSKVLNKQVIVNVNKFRTGYND